MGELIHYTRVWDANVKNHHQPKDSEDSEAGRHVHKGANVGGRGADSGPQE